MFKIRLFESIDRMASLQWVWCSTNNLPKLNSLFDCLTYVFEHLNYVVGRVVSPDWRQMRVIPISSGQLWCDQNAMKLVTFRDNWCIHALFFLVSVSVSFHILVHVHTILSHTMRTLLLDTGHLQLFKVKLIVKCLNNMLIFIIFGCSWPFNGQSNGVFEYRVFDSDCLVLPVANRLITLSGNILNWNFSFLLLLLLVRKRYDRKSDIYPSRFRSLLKFAVFFFLPPPQLLHFKKCCRSIIISSIVVCHS